MKGYVQVYTGNGKGKTTAAIGLAVRAEDVRAARKGLAGVEKALSSGNYDVVILDEAAIALYFKLIAVDDVMSLIKAKPSSCEVVITGRYAPPELVAAISVLCRHAGIDCFVVDMGVDGEFGDEANLIKAKIGNGTRGFLDDCAMTDDECERALDSGIAIAKSGNSDLHGIGDMGI